MRGDMLGDLEELFDDLECDIIARIDARLARLGYEKVVKCGKCRHYDGVGYCDYYDNDRNSFAVIAGKDYCSKGEPKEVI